jgi:hypothetical protein
MKFYESRHMVLRRARKSVFPFVGVLILTATTMSGQSACDLDGNGTTNVVDVNRAVGMVIGSIPCTANVEGPLTCTIVTVQRVVNVVLGQPCVTYTSSQPRAVLLTWLPVTGAVGYNMYRSASPTSGYTKVNASLTTTATFTDSSVQLGQTYYYEVTAVDAFGVESDYSDSTTAVLPVT